MEVLGDVLVQSLQQLAVLIVKHNFLRAEVILNFLIDVLARLPGQVLNFVGSAIS